MLNQVFKTLLVMSLTGGLLTLVLLLLKPVTARVFGHRWQYYIWHSVLWVLVLPVKVSAGWSLPTHISSKIHAITVQPIHTRMVVEDLNGVYHAQNAPYAAEQVGAEIFSALAFCWAAVAIILAIRLIFNYIRMKKLLGMNSAPFAEIDGVCVRRCEAITVPLLIGTKSPVLYIPSGMDQNLDKIMAHERVHIKRNDLVYKWFASLVKCVHWFNPLVWVMAKQFDEACEISCDVQAAADMSKDEKTEYMKTLVELSQKSLDCRSAMALGLTSGGRTLKKRLHAIGKNNKRSRILAALGVVIAITITFVSVYAGGVLQNSTGFVPDAAEYVLVSSREEKPAEIPVVAEKEAEEIPEAASEPVIEAENKEEPVVTSSESAVKVIRGDFSSEGGSTRHIQGVKANADGCIKVEIHSSAQEVVDIYVQNAETGRDVFSFSIPVQHTAAYLVEGLEPGKSYNLVLKGEMRDNWNIDGEYIIQY